MKSNEGVGAIAWEIQGGKWSSILQVPEVSKVEPGPQGLGRELWERIGAHSPWLFVAELRLIADAALTTLGEAPLDPRGLPGVSWAYLVNAGDKVLELWTRASCPEGTPGAVVADGRPTILILAGRVPLSGEAPDWEGVELWALAARQRYERAQGVAA